MKNYPFLTFALCTAVILVVFSISFNARRFTNSSDVVSSNTNQMSLVSILCISIVLLGHLITDNWGKLYLGRKWDGLLPLQLVVVLIVLLPSLFCLMFLETLFISEFYWPLLHLQIILLIHIALVFWAYKMGNKTILIDVYLNSLLSGAAFTSHIYPTGPIWDFQYNDATVLLFRILFIISTLSLCSVFYRSFRTHYLQHREPITPDEKWALIATSLVLMYYIGFFIFDLVYPGSHNHSTLGAYYIAANNYWLAALAFFLSILLVRKDRREGVVSEASLEIKRLFVKYVSHEVRTPLQTTLGGLSLLENHIEKKAILNRSVLREMIEDATSSCNTAIEIMSELLLYEKIEGGLLDLEKEEVEFWDFVGDTIKVFLLQAKNKEVQLSWPVACVPGVFADVDKHKLSQVLRNVLSNALKFTPTGGRIKVSASVITTFEPPSAREHSLTRYDESPPAKSAVTIKPSFGANRMEDVVDQFEETFDEVGPESHVVQLFDDGSLTPKYRNTDSLTDTRTNSNTMSNTHVSSLNTSNIQSIESSTPVTPTQLFHRRQENDSPHSALRIEESGSGSPGLPPAGKIHKFTANGNGPSNGSADTYSQFPGIAVERASDNGSIVSGSQQNSPSKPTSRHKRSFYQPSGSFDFSAIGMGIRRILSTDTERSIRIFAKTAMVRIIVTDTGAGISKENQQRLFKEIVQFDAKKLQEGKGSGIGLWISGQIVKMHGGRIGVVSEGEGKGSTFYIDIPVARIVGNDYREVSLNKAEVNSTSKYESPHGSPATDARVRKLKLQILQQQKKVELIQSRRQNGDDVNDFSDSYNGSVSGYSFNSGEDSSLLTADAQLEGMKSSRSSNSSGKKSSRSFGSKSSQNSIPGRKKPSPTAKQFTKPLGRYYEHMPSRDDELGSPHHALMHKSPSVRSCGSEHRIACSSPASSPSRYSVSTSSAAKSTPHRLTSDGITAAARGAIESLIEVGVHGLHTVTTPITKSLAGTISAVHIYSSPSPANTPIKSANENGHQLFSSPAGGMVSPAGPHPDIVNGNCDVESNMGGQKKGTVTIDMSSRTQTTASHSSSFSTVADRYELPMCRTSSSSMMPFTRTNTDSTDECISDRTGKFQNREQVAYMFNMPSGSNSGSFSFPNINAESSNIPPTFPDFPRKFVPNKRDSIAEEHEVLSEHSDSMNICNRSENYHNAADRAGLHNRLSIDTQSTDEGVRRSYSNSEASELDYIRSSSIEGIDNADYYYFEAQSGRAAAELSSDTQEQQTKSVLIVDDSITNRKLVSRLLQEDFTVVDQAENGLIGCQMCEAAMKLGRAYDVILMDYLMPEMDGPSAAAVIRESGYKGSIVGLTGKTEKAEIQNFIDSGANEVLIKPLNPKKFTTIIENLVNSSRASI